MTLVGFSLGARVIFFCLEALAKKGKSYCLHPRKIAVIFYTFIFYSIKEWWRAGSGGIFDATEIV